MDRSSLSGTYQSQRSWEFESQTSTRWLLLGVVLLGLLRSRCRRFRPWEESLAPYALIIEESYDSVR